MLDLIRFSCFTQCSRNSLCETRPRLLDLVPAKKYVFAKDTEIITFFTSPQSNIALQVWFVDGDPSVKDSYFITYHTPMITSREFYTALKQVRMISENLNEMFKKRNTDVRMSSM